MSELLTAKDVEIKMFKKVSFGGYSISDVEEFLNQIAEDLETYALRMSDQQRRIHELEDALKRHEDMKDTIKDALILAQKSAKEKEESAKRQAEHILADAEARLDEMDGKNRQRLEEAEDAADEIVSAARTAAAQIIKSAEEMKEDAQKRLDGAEAEAARVLGEAGEKASEITAEARVEARRTSGKAKRDMEDYRRELESLIAEKRRFLKDAQDLASTFTRMVEDAAKKSDGGEGRERITLPFAPVNDPSLDDEAAIS